MQVEEQIEATRGEQRPQTQQFASHGAFVEGDKLDVREDRRHQLGFGFADDPSEPGLPPGIFECAKRGRRVAHIADGRQAQQTHILRGRIEALRRLIEAMWHRPMMTNDDGRRIATSAGPIVEQGRRIATSAGAILSDSVSLAGMDDAAVESVFEPGYWAARGELLDVTGGRGAAWFIGKAGRWALRHYRRGGWIARLSADRYVWGGEARVRSFAEWRLLAALTRLGLPVPKPIAARFERTGLLYRCDLITVRIAGTRPLSAALTEAPLQQSWWYRVGAVVARLHAAGVDHADLNAHNILLDAAGAVSVIDFDRGRLRRSGPWAARNLDRLQRSLAKVARPLPPDRFSAEAWSWLLAGYADAPAPANIAS